MAQIYKLASDRGGWQKYTFFHSISKEKSTTFIVFLYRFFCFIALFAN